MQFSPIRGGCGRSINGSFCLIHFAFDAILGPLNRGLEKIRVTTIFFAAGNAQLWEAQ
jgi:hypothetical protein